MRRVRRNRRGRGAPNRGGAKETVEGFPGGTSLLLIDGGDYVLIDGADKVLIGD